MQFDRTFVLCIPPKNCAGFCAVLPALSAVALAQINFAKNKQIEENVKLILIAASQPK